MGLRPEIPIGLSYGLVDLSKWTRTLRGRKRSNG